VFAVDTWADTVKRARTKDGAFHLALPDLLEELAKLPDAPVQDPAFPFVLSAGERRSFTANTIIRNPEWRKKGADGALRIHPDDAAALGVVTGETVRLTTRRHAVVVPVEVSASMHRGHVSLPNGLGLGYPGSGVTGVAPNELTSTEDRDPFVGTPWHKHVPARVERA
jgi:anaerobic selenocysteine-containing dehydrogenase